MVTRELRLFMYANAYVYIFVSVSMERYIKSSEEKKKSGSVSNFLCQKCSIFHQLLLLAFEFE